MMGKLTNTIWCRIGIHNWLWQIKKRSLYTQSGARICGRCGKAQSWLWDSGRYQFKEIKNDSKM